MRWRKMTKIKNCEIHHFQDRRSATKNRIFENKIIAAFLYPIN